ncbi:zinc finger protein 99-like X3, partial [Biomphalaria pfeifferi]
PGEAHNLSQTIKSLSGLAPTESQACVPNTREENTKERNSAKSAQPQQRQRRNDNKAHT